MHISMHARAQVCSCVDLFVQTQPHARTSESVCMNTAVLWCTHAHVYVSMSTYTYIRSSIRPYIHTYIQKFMRAWILTKNTYIHTFIHTYIHTYIKNTYIHKEHIHACIYAYTHAYKLNYIQVLTTRTYTFKDLYEDFYVCPCFLAGLGRGPRPPAKALVESVAGLGTASGGLLELGFFLGF